MLLRNSKIFIPKKDSLLIFLTGVPIVMLEQLYTVIGLVFLSFFGIWYFELGIFVLSFFTALLVFVFVIISSRRIFNRVILIFGKWKFTSKFVEPLSSSYDTIKKSTRGPITFYAIALTTLFWLIEAVVVYFVLLSFGINSIDLLNVIPIYTTSLMLGFLSFLPMGLGVVEGSLASFFSLQGVSISLSLTIVVIIRLFTRWYGVIVGFLALKFSGGFSLGDEPIRK